MFTNLKMKKEETSKLLLITQMSDVLLLFIAITKIVFQLLSHTKRKNLLKSEAKS